MTANEVERLDYDGPLSFRRPDIRARQGEKHARLYFEDTRVQLRAKRPVTETDNTMFRLLTLSPSISLDVF